MGPNRNQVMGTLLIAALLTPLSAVAEQDQYHDCVVIVVDLSGSMEEAMPGDGPRKIDAAKQALRVVVPKLSSSTWVGIVVTPDGQWPYELAPRDNAKLLAAIERLEISGGTPLARHIKIGADRLLAERAKQFGYGNYRLLIVTDGQETENEHAINAYPSDVRSRGLTLDVIGVAMTEDHVLKRYANTYRDPADPASLERAVRELLAERVDSNDRGADGEDGFALIAGIDPGVAQVMIGALGKLPNHPIGESPPVATTGGGGGSTSGGGGGSGVTPPNLGCGCRTAAEGRVPFREFGAIALLGLLRSRRRARLARVRSRSSR